MGGRPYSDDAVNTELVFVMLHVLGFDPFLEVVSLAEPAGVDGDHKGQRILYLRARGTGPICDENATHMVNKIKFGSFLTELPSSCVLGGLSCQIPVRGVVNNYEFHFLLGQDRS